VFVSALANPAFYRDQPSNAAGGNGHGSGDGGGDGETLGRLALSTGYEGKAMDTDDTVMKAISPFASQSGSDDEDDEEEFEEDGGHHDQQDGNAFNTPHLDHGHNNDSNGNHGNNHGDGGNFGSGSSLPTGRRAIRVLQAQTQLYGPQDDPMGSLYSQAPEEYVHEDETYYASKEWAVEEEPDEDDVFRELYPSCEPKPSALTKAKALLFKKMNKPAAVAAATATTTVAEDLACSQDHDEWGLAAHAFEYSTELTNCKLFFCCFFVFFCLRLLNPMEGNYGDGQEELQSAFS